MVKAAPEEEIAEEEISEEEAVIAVFILLICMVFSF
jgi:hypothetical protein